MSEVSEELKPCPLCSREVGMVDYAGWEIDCECGLSLAIKDPTKERTIKAWNTRAGE